jgi:MFS superfamily sulfate permease-like transporter
LAAGLIGSFAVNASPPRTAVVRAAGGRSQLTNVVGAVVALGVVLWAAGALKNLPQATLGAILLFVATKLVRARELRSVLRFERVEFGLAVLATAVVVFFGIEQGVVVAMLLSLADRTRRAARPRDIVLGREVGTSHWIPPDVGRQTEQLPGVLVYLLYAPLWYANADFVAARIRRLIDTAEHPVRTLILDADAVADIDYTAARKIGELATQLRQEGVTTAVARASHLVHHDLKHSGLLRAIGPDHLYASVEEAVEAAVKDAKS